MSIILMFFIESQNTLSWIKRTRITEVHLLALYMPAQEPHRVSESVVQTLSVLGGCAL